MPLVLFSLSSLAPASVACADPGLRATSLAEPRGGAWVLLRAQPSKPSWAQDLRGAGGVHPLAPLS